MKGREQPVAAWRAEEALAAARLPPRPWSSAPLVGREAEMGMLCSTVENTIGNDRASLLLLLGEAGVGKSRLAEELASHSEREHNTLILEGRCVPYGEANVWWPIADALRHGAGIRSTDPADRAVELARIAVLHRARRGRRARPGRPGPPGAALPHGLRERAARHRSRPRPRGGHRRRRHLRRAACPLNRPVALVLSDLHWADDLVLELVNTLLERLATRPVVVLATARQSIEERWHPPHGRNNLVVLTLDPLTAGASAELLADLAGAELADDLAHALLDRSGGNPFFLEELVTLLTEAGLVGGDGALPRPAAELVELPDTLRGLVAARLDGLTADERRVLDDCAVLGRRGPMRAIEVMARKHSGIDDVRPVLASLEAKELLVLSGSGDGERWTFRSDFVREVAYGTLTKADRARSHAGDRVLDGAPRGRQPRRDGRPDRAPLRTRRPSCTTSWGRWRGSPTTSPSRPSGGWRRRPTAPTRPRSRSWPSGSTARGFASCGVCTVPGTARSSPVGPARCPVCASWRRPEPTRWPPSTRAARREPTVGPTSARRCSCWPTSSRRRPIGAPPTRRSTRRPTVFAELGDASGEAEVLRQRGFGALFRHEYDTASALLERALAGFEALDDARGTAWALQNLAWCAFYSGRAEDAEGLLRRAAATFEEIGDVGGQRWVKGLLAWTRFQQGYAGEAGAMAEEILSSDWRGGDRWALGMLLVLSGSVRLWTGSTLDRDRAPPGGAGPLRGDQRRLRLRPVLGGPGHGAGPGRRHRARRRPRDDGRPEP